MEVQLRTILDAQQLIQDDLDCLSDSGWFVSDSARKRFFELACEIVCNRFQPLLRGKDDVSINPEA